MAGEKQFIYFIWIMSDKIPLRSLYQTFMVNIKSILLFSVVLIVLTVNELLGVLEMEFYINSERNNSRSKFTKIDSLSLRQVSEFNIILEKILSAQNQCVTLQTEKKRM